MWPFRRPRTDPPRLELALEALQLRVDVLERGIVALRGDLLAWEAAAAKMTRELSRHLKAIAEVERRQALKDQDPDPDPLDEEEDLVTRTRRFAGGR